MASKDASDAPGWGERGTSTVSFSSTAGLLGTAGLPGDDQRALQEGIYSKMNKRIVPMFMAVMVLNNIGEHATSERVRPPVSRRGDCMRWWRDAHACGQAGARW